ncbi:MAG: hypothetical protein DMF78_26470 [Acidobacteria bacterium]|nr:MAG: hypothetical protein DMF78_26470 [Acidobacteriota bacterium]
MQRSTLMAMAVLAAGVPLAVVRAAQEPPADRTPSFPSQASAITVDAVVLDRAGAPIRGLTRDDFTILEDGRPQTIVGFEARDVLSVRPAAEDTTASPLLGTNVGRAARSGRMLVVLMDDLGMTPTTTQQVKTALERWLRAGPRAEDDITLLTTSGDIWWADTIGAGRQDLLAVVERLRGKREARSRSELTMTDEEASIVEYASPVGGEAGDSQGSPGTAAVGPPAVTGPPLIASSASVLDRVMRRFLDQSLCFICLSCADPMASCRSAAQSAAHLINLATRRRLDVLLATIERLARSLAPLAGRKSILVLSEGFPRDEGMEARYREVIDAAQRANTSVYFTAARGLTGESGYSADSRTAPAPGDLAMMNVEENLLAFAGAAQLTEETGGALTHSNDLAAGLERIATDLSAYYLLGYQPEPSAAGKWHRLEVRVARPGAKVRARRGYRAGPPAPEPVPAGKSARRELQAGGARVQVVVEVDGSRLQIDKTAAGSKAALELTILAVARDRPTVLPLRESLDIGRRPEDVAGWLALFREVRLPPGVAQVRATLRDRAGGATGTVTARVEVPDIDAPYLSTPLLTDRTQPPLVPGEPPRLVPTALRRFTHGRPLHCQYEVFGFGGRDMPGVAQVAGGYTLQAEDGRVIEMVPPTLIATDGTRVVRRITIPTERLEPGAYELLLSVEDRLARRAFSARAAFVVEAEVAGSP